MRLAKLAVVIPLLLIAAFFAWYGGFIISNIFADYKDSSDATYLTVGGTSLVIAALFAAAALLVAARPHHRWGWLALAVLALLAGSMPYADMVGTVGYGVSAILIVLAVGSALAYLLGGTPQPPADAQP